MRLTPIGQRKILKYVDIWKVHSATQKRLPEPGDNQFGHSSSDSRAERCATAMNGYVHSAITCNDTAPGIVQSHVQCERGVSHIPDDSNDRVTARKTIKKMHECIVEHRLMCEDPSTRRLCHSRKQQGQASMDQQTVILFFSMGRKRLWDFLIRATDYATVMSQTAMPDTVTTLLIRGHILIWGHIVVWATDYATQVSMPCCSHSNIHSYAAHWLRVYVLGVFVFTWPCARTHTHLRGTLASAISAQIIAYNDMSDSDSWLKSPHTATIITWVAA